MAVFDTVKQFEKNLDLAIDIAMSRGGTVCNGVEDELTKQAQQRVYDAYEPKFESRYGDFGGIMDKGYMIENYDPSTKTLTIRQNTPWQHLRGGAYPMANLNDVIEHKGIYGAQPRPYIEEAEQSYASQQFEIDLSVALADLGL